MVAAQQTSSHGYREAVEEKEWRVRICVGGGAPYSGQRALSATRPSSDSLQIVHFEHLNVVLSVTKMANKCQSKKAAVAAAIREALWYM